MSTDRHGDPAQDPGIVLKIHQCGPPRGARARPAADTGDASSMPAAAAALQESKRLKASVAAEAAVAVAAAATQRQGLWSGKGGDAVRT